MSRQIDSLTEQLVMQAEPGNKPRKLFDGYGMYLDVMPTGKKVWRMKYRQDDGQENRLTFGRYPEVSLALARCRRSVARQMLHDGLDPRTEFNDAKMRPPKKVKPCSNPAARQAIERLRTLVLPLLCRVPADEIMRTDILATLEKIQQERSAAVIDVLYDVCAEIIFSCLSIGIDDLIEARMARQLDSVLSETSALGEVAAL
jgi:hypothetical protein